ncbi:MAG: hypothetical protein IJ291_04700 [Lachnospiraceae bacterium]|nr:hypothetical protein [Lachnospiraceae bacterium]
MKKFRILVVLLIVVSLIGCNTMNVSNDVTQEQSEQASSSEAASEDDGKAESDTIELVPINWNEPKVSTEEISFEDACAHIDAMSEKYYVYNWEDFVNFNYYSLSEETIDKLDKKYDKKYNYTTGNYLNKYMIRDMYYYVTNEITIYNAYKEGDHSQQVRHDENYYTGEEFEKEIVKEKFSSYFSLEEMEEIQKAYTIETFDDYMALFPKLSDYVMDENLKKQADAIDQYAYDFATTYKDMLVIVCEIMERCPIEEIPEELRDEFYDSQYYSLAHHRNFLRIQYKPNNLSDKAIEFAKSYEELYITFVKENEDLFLQLEEKTRELNEIYGTLFSYFVDMESVNHPLPFVYSFESGQSKGTNLETLNLVLVCLADKISEMQKDYIYYKDRVSGGVALEEKKLANALIPGYGNKLKIQWKVDIQATYAVLYATYYKTVPCGLAWSDKESVAPDSLELDNGFMSEYEMDWARNQLIDIIESRGYNVKEFVYRRSVMEEYGFDDEWLDKYYN